MDPLAVVERAVRFEEEGRLEDARSAWIEVAGHLPNEAIAFERLFQLHVHRREVDAAFCAASVLASLDALDGMARELYEDYVPRRAAPHVLGASLDEEDWALLRHPDEDPAFGESLRPLLSKVRLRPVGAGAIDTGTLAWAAKLLDVRDHDFLPDGAPAMVGGADLDDVWRNYTLRERLFFAGRAATALRVPVHALEDAGRRELAQAHGGPDVKGLAQWLTSVELTRAYAGMLVCGEPSVARELLARENAPASLIGAVMVFAVSPNHHRLRAKLGIAIGATADAPDASAPTGNTVTKAVARPLAPAPPLAPRLAAPPPRLVAIMNAVILSAEPPKTVRDLERALGLTLTDTDLSASTIPGELVLHDGLPPPLARVTLKWRGTTTPRSVEALRGRALAEGWSFELSEGRGYVDARLCARFDTPRDLGTEQHYASQHGVFVLSWADGPHGPREGAQKEQSCRLELRPLPLTAPS